MKYNIGPTFLNSESFEWREQLVRTYLDYDLPSLGIHHAPLQLFRFWQMAAHYHGQVWNHSEIARSLGITIKTLST